MLLKKTVRYTISTIFARRPDMDCHSLGCTLLEGRHWEEDTQQAVVHRDSHLVVVVGPPNWEVVQREERTDYRQVGTEEEEIRNSVLD